MPANMKTVEARMLAKSMAAHARSLRHEIYRYRFVPEMTSPIMRLQSKTKRFSRALNLARAFLKGRPYIEVEQSCKNSPDWDMVVELVKVFAPYDFVAIPEELFHNSFEAWKTT